VPKHLRVGSQTYDLGPPIVIDGLFATVTYRLEPHGRGTRLLVAAADGAIMAGPDGATLPTVDGSEWTTPKANWLQKENQHRQR